MDFEVYITAHGGISQGSFIFSLQSAFYYLGPVEKHKDYLR